MDILNKIITPILYENCFPYIFPKNYEGVSLCEIENKFIDSDSIPTILLDKSFDLNSILYNPFWLNNSIKDLAIEYRKENHKGISDIELGKAFHFKYGDSFESDARFVVKNWFFEVQQILNLLNPKILEGNMLHIGSDTYFEPKLFHMRPIKIFLVDIAKDLLRKFKSKSSKIFTIPTRVENLYQIPKNYIDFVVALRVFSSFSLDKEKAILKITEKLRNGGAIFLSVSNGYRALDDTILPGQITGDPAILDLSLPFKESEKIIRILYNNGFREIKFIPGSAELFIIARYLPLSQISLSIEDTLTVKGFQQIPLNFYSEKTPIQWINNFSLNSIQIDNKIWPTVEHYFQAQKFLSESKRELIRNCDSAQQAKALAWDNEVDIRIDWPIVKIDIMRKALKAKFDQHLLVRAFLIKTGHRTLVELSPFDKFWGRTINGEGLNNMGMLLMILRNYYNTKMQYEA